MRTELRTAVRFLGVIWAVSALACTSAHNVGGTGGSGSAADETCFNVRNVDSVSPLHPSFVYVRLLRGEEYLLTLDTLYMTLPYATGVKISNEFSRVCSDSGAMLTFKDASHPVSCRIIRVEAVASRAAAEELVKNRTAPGAKK